MVDPFERESRFIWDGAVWSPFLYTVRGDAPVCVDDEVRIEVDVTCRISEEDFESVSVETEVRLYEGTTCLSEDQDGEESRAILLDPCGADCTSVPMNAPIDGTTLKVRNEDEGGDFANINVTMSNCEQSAHEPCGTP
jgi:hypothetical protein